MKRKNGTGIVFRNCSSEFPILRSSVPVHSLVGLRDRALIGKMISTFARVGTVAKMLVRDFYSTGRRNFLRLKEKGGKNHEVPVHLKLKEYLDA